MIAMLEGKVEQMSGRALLLNVRGVGYEIFCPAHCIKGLKPGAQARFEIYTDVKQDGIRLYGFSDQLERQVFLMLLRVQGVGARSASEVLSSIDKRDLLRAIAAEDLNRLQTVKGIGKKTAQRLVVELKDKVAEFVEEFQLGLPAKDPQVLSPAEEAIQALQALGFIRKDAERAVETAQAQTALNRAPSGEVVREALKYI